MRPLVNSSSFSPKSANHSTSGSHVSDDGLDYNSASPSRLKGKKRERENDSLKMIKRAAVKSTSILKTDIAELIEKGELADLEAVDEVVQLMHTDKIEKKMDLVCRSNIAGAISSTSKFECLSQFVELGGLCILDEWLQEVHKGNTGDRNGPMKGDVSIEEFLVSLLNALDKLPVNLPELRMSNIGKSVNMLRNHKNMEIRKKARRLVHLWKKRVEAELAHSSAKDGCTENATASAKSPASGGSHGGNKSPSESPPLKHSYVETQMLVSVVEKSAEDSMANSKAALLLKGIQHKTSASDVGHDAPLSAFEDDKSCNSSLSHTSQSCPSDQITNGISPKKEDSQSSCAGSLTNKLVLNDRSRDKKLLSGMLDPAFPGIHKESRSKRITLCRYKPTKRLPHSEVSNEKENKVPITSGCSHKLIVKFPNRIRRPFKSMTCSSPEKPSVKPDHSDFISRGSSEFRKPHVDSALMIESWQSNECMDTLNVSDRGEGSATTADKENLKNMGGGMNVSQVSEDVFSSSLVREEIVSFHEGSVKSLSVVTEGRPTESEICKTVPPGCDGGMILLADVAAGDMFESDVSGLTNTPVRTLEVGNSSPGSVCLSANANNNVQGSLVHTEQVDEDLKRQVEAGATLTTLKNRATVSPFNNNLCRNLDHSMMQVEHTESLVNDVNENSGDIVVTLPTVAVTGEIVVRQSTSKVVEEEIGERMDKSYSKLSVSNGENTLEKAVDIITDELASKPIIGSDTYRHMVVDIGLSNDTTPSAIVSNAMEEREGDVSLQMDARNKVKECISSNTDVGSATSDMDSRLKFGFDLNETCDDGENVLCSTSETLPISSTASGAFSASVTVAAAPKEPFNPPGDLSKNKGEVGWKGSAATSAFRSAEPRKAITIQSSTISGFVADKPTTKESQRVLDFDLNEAYVGSPENADCASVLDPYGKMFKKSADSSRFDLNLSDQISAGKDYKPGFPPFLSKKAVNISAVPLKNQSSFDLNSCLDEVAADISPFERKSLRSQIPVPGVVMNSVGRTNVLPWLPGSTVTAQVPWFGERIIPLTSLEVGTSNMTPRALGNIASNAIPLFGANIISTAVAEEAQMFMNISNGMPTATPGGPMLASSHAPSFDSPFQHAHLPFGTGCPMPPMPLSGSTVLVDSSSGRRQIVPGQSHPSGPTSAAYSSYYPRPYLVSLSGGSSNGGSRHHWDLNASRLGVETERSTFNFQMSQLSFANANPVPVHPAGMHQAASAVMKSKLDKEP